MDQWVVSTTSKFRELISVGLQGIPAEASDGPPDRHRAGFYTVPYATEGHEATIVMQVTISPTSIDLNIGPPRGGNWFVQVASGAVWIPIPIPAFQGSDGVLYDSATGRYHWARLIEFPHVILRQKV